MMLAHPLSSHCSFASCSASLLRSQVESDTHTATPSSDDQSQPKIPENFHCSSSLKRLLPLRRGTIRVYPSPTTHYNHLITIGEACIYVTIGPDIMPKPDTHAKGAGRAAGGSSRGSTGAAAIPQSGAATAASGATRKDKKAPAASTGPSLGASSTGVKPKGKGAAVAVAGQPDGGHKLPLSAPENSTNIKQVGGAAGRPAAPSRTATAAGAVTSAGKGSVKEKEKEKGKEQSKPAAPVKGKTETSKPAAKQVHARHVPPPKQVKQQIAEDEADEDEEEAGSGMEGLEFDGMSSEGSESEGDDASDDGDSDAELAAARLDGEAELTSRSTPSAAAATTKVPAKAKTQPGATTAPASATASIPANKGAKLSSSSLVAAPSSTASKAAAKHAVVLSGDGETKPAVARVSGAAGKGKAALLPREPASSDEVAGVDGDGSGQDDSASEEDEPVRGRKAAAGLLDSDSDSGDDGQVEDRESIDESEDEDADGDSEDDDEDEVDDEDASDEEGSEAEDDEFGEGVDIEEASRRLEAKRARIERESAAEMRLNVAGAGEPDEDRFVLPSAAELVSCALAHALPRSAAVNRESLQPQYGHGHTLTAIPTILLARLS